MPQKYVPVDGIATLVHHRGPTTLPGHPPDLARRPIILCAHGAGGNGNEFAGVLDALAETATPLAYDQPGHGRSGGLDSLGSVPAIAAHLRGLAVALGVTKPVLLGDGLGAAVALEAAVTDPHLPAALVLTGGATARPAVGDESLDQLRRIVAGKDRRQFDTSGYAPTTPRDIYGLAFREWMKTDPRATLGDREAERSWDGRGRLAAVTAPTLVIVGEAEDAGDKDAARALAAELPGARVVEVAAAGRRVVMEQPAELARLVTGFLEDVVEVGA